MMNAFLSRGATCAVVRKASCSWRKMKNLDPTAIQNNNDIALNYSTKSSSPPSFVTVNGRNYSFPKQPLVAICIDGSEPEYIEEAVAGGYMPFTEKILLANGTNLRGHSVVPSFTNPNNVSIVTGAPPNIHGISGNFFLDQESGEEIMMNDPKFLRAKTIFQAFHDNSDACKVAIVTAKDKLRRLLGNGLNYESGRAICFSSEKANETTFVENGVDNAQDTIMNNRPIPDVYSAELSEYIFDASVKLMESFKPDIMYLSTTDYIQHKHAPGTPVANEFYAMMDGYWKELHDTYGAVLAITADHGMNAKFNPSTGEPDVIYLQSLLDEWLNKNETTGTSSRSTSSSPAARVILPITDPYVVHHGALGSFATVYLSDPTIATDLAQRLTDEVEGIEAAVTKFEGCITFDLPPDRVGDLLVLATTNKVIGTTPERHDLTQLKNEPLRSHGGFCDSRIPLIFSQKVDASSLEPLLHNYDMFDLALNHSS